MALTLAFVMDPVERVDAHTDTTFAFMLAARDRGHRVHHVDPRGLELEGDRLFLHAREARVRPGSPLELGAAARLAADDCACIFVRTDPPFDLAYLEATWLLSFAERRGVWVVNSPRGLRTANEKLYALEWPELCPPTLVSASAAAIRAFVDARGGEAVLKPLDGHGGFGVLRLRHGDSNVSALIDLVSAEGRRPVLVQEFLPDVTGGDRRLFVVGGELRAVLRRMPRAGEHRANVHAGGTAAASEPTAADRAIAAAVRERLRADGLYFVGLDVIGDRLIEVNVTSPTLVQELRRFGGPDLAAEVIDEVERRVAAGGQSSRASTASGSLTAP